MKRIQTFSPILLSGVWIWILLSFSGCIDDYGMSGIADGNTATVTLDLLVPGAFVGMQTRAMDTGQEKAIYNLQVLIFEETAAGEVFRHIGEVTESSEARVTLKLPVGNVKYRFVILANAATQTITDGEAKQEALNRFAFDCAGRWPTEGDKSYIPMWGEHRETISVTADQNITIGLHRALARVDVGLMFKPQTQDNQTEAVEGLDNFKITSVRVYRTKNKAYVASSADKMNSNNEIFTPYIHPEAKFNSNNGTAYGERQEADQDPLLYQVSPASDSYIREIYIPESALYDKAPANTGMDDVPCLVIGGYYGTDNGSEETFYRVDFADYNSEGGVSTIARYKLVLRNHRYVFNILSVNSPGFREPEQALHSVNAKMELSVVAWNEVPLNYHITGDYFFRIERREVWLDAVSQVDPLTGQGHPIVESLSFHTNIPFIEDPDHPGEASVLRGFKNAKWTWASSGTTTSDFWTTNFLAKENKILFQANAENVGRIGTPVDVLHDVMTLTVENMQLTIDVYQKAANLIYTMRCERTIVHGKYREGVPLNYTHYIEVTIEPDGDPLNETDEIEIKTEIRKGIGFSYKGTLQNGIADGNVTDNSDGTYTIKLQGDGIPVKDFDDPVNPDTPEGVLTRIDNLHIQSNSINDQNYCTTTIIFGYRSKKILAIGANAIYRYGYVLEPNTGSRAFVDASTNFGVDPNSAVTMEQNAENNAFTIDYMTAGRGMSGERIDKDYLEERLKNFKPDIILTGQAINYQPDDIRLIDRFINKGGVFLMFNEYYPSVDNTNAMVNMIMGSDMEGSNVTTSYDNIVYRIEGDDEKDPILNGPFGDIRNQQWGADGIALHGFKGVTSDNAYIYSRREHDDNAVSVFRHKTKPFFYIGDGGFISNAKRYIGDSYQGSYVYCPFAINGAYQPVDRINYTNGRDETVCNSRFFGNILAWAVDYAEHHPVQWE